MERKNMNTKNEAALRPELQELVAKVRAMRELTKATSFQTSRSIGALLGRLNPDDLATVSLELQK